MGKLALTGGQPAVTCDFPRWPEVDAADEQAVLDTLRSGRWWMYDADFDGSEKLSQVESFERAFAAAHNVKHCITVNSGSSALEACTRAIELQPGDEVITTPYTFFATTTCILQVGACPVYVDIDESYNLDPTQIEAAITDRTRAILPVHFAGEIADMDAINAVAEKHGLTVIEDAAQAAGASLKGDRFAGSLGLGGIVSFQASKNLCCGEGGAVLTNDDALADAAWSLRNYGRSRSGYWYQHDLLGCNWRLPELTASLLRSQLDKLFDQNARRQRNVDRLYARLENVQGLDGIRLNPRADRRAHHIIILRYDAAAWSAPRESFLEALNAEGVPCSGGYAVTSFENPVFEHLKMSDANSRYMAGRSAPIDYAGFEKTCPRAIRACREEAVWLSNSLFLSDDPSMVDQICDAIDKLSRHRDELRHPAAT